MPFLYNCRHSGDQYRITKFDEHMNVESTYLCTEKECDCPAGQRPTCRHREMLPKFIHRKMIGTEWFFDYDRGGWVQMGKEFAQPTMSNSEAIAEIQFEDLTGKDWAQPPAETVVEERPKEVHIRRRR